MSGQVAILEILASNIIQKISMKVSRCVFIQAVHSQILKRLAWRRGTGGVSMVLPEVEGSIPSEYCLMRTRSSLGSSCYPEGQESVEHLNPADQLNLLESIQRSS